MLFLSLPTPCSSLVRMQLEKDACLWTQSLGVPHGPGIYTADQRLSQVLHQTDRRFRPFDLPRQDTLITSGLKFKERISPSFSNLGLPVKLISESIIPLKQFLAELETEPTLIDSFSYAGQPSGWIDKPIFADIVKKTLISEFEQRRRSLGPGSENQWGILYVDGHTSREQPEVLEILREHKIDVISFVAHASHLLQPLDLWVFLMLKESLESSRAQFSASRPEQRMQMLRELEKALAFACMKSNILKSFQLSGIYPVKPSAVLADQFGSAPKQEEAASSDKQKRNYININGKLLTASEIVEALRARDKIKADKEAKKRSREEKKSSRRVQE